MKRIRVGLNGFGRIGRAFTRIALTEDRFDVVVINTRKTETAMMAYLLQYDTVYRNFHKKVEVQSDSLVIENKTIETVRNAEIESIPWEKYNVDVVVDATGAFMKEEELSKHLRGSVKKVILTAPSKDDTTPHVVLGVNDD
ncbi:MAG: glyceraldehyde 3-phosphate dehydrogenase NAD-binding domain-containing protein, partial [Microgenomates group bacterium]